MSTFCAAVVAVVMSTSFLVVTVWAKQVAFAFRVINIAKGTTDPRVEFILPK